MSREKARQTLDNFLRRGARLANPEQYQEFRRLADSPQQGTFRQRMRNFLSNMFANMVGSYPQGPGWRGGGRTGKDYEGYEKGMPVGGQVESDVVERFIKLAEPFFVVSSNVASAQYLVFARKMYVEYLNGYGYIYSDISEIEARSFMQADSKGKWVWNYLRIRGKGNAGAPRKPYVRVK